MRDDPPPELPGRPLAPGARPGQPARPRSGPTAIATLLLALFAAGGVFFGCIFAGTLVDVLGGPPPPPTPAVLVARPSAVLSVTPAPPGATPRPTTPPDPLGGVPVWQSPDRVTVLLLGLDMREDERGQPTRSDTMILVTIDPVRKRAGLLSIPRDLWVPIPGHGENKINTAHFFGEMDRPGGGPDLARRTVEYNFGIRVNHWARVDFRGFADLIDAIGGVTIDVEKPVKDDEYPTEDYGIRRVYIATGLQHMGGAEALRYARSRHSENDFRRNYRQQAVLLAARNEVLQPAILPKVPQMLGILRGALQTDVPITDILPLFNMARGIQAQDITSRAIDYSMVIDPDGSGSVLVPDRKKIRPVIDELFSDTPPTPTPTPSPLPTPSPTRAAPVVVQIQNGTLRDGLAAGTAERLRARGYVVRDVSQASRSDYAATVIMDHTGRPQVAGTLAQLLGVPASAIKRAQPAESGADVTVILGLDAPGP